MESPGMYIYIIYYIINMESPGLVLDQFGSRWNLEAALWKTVLVESILKKVALDPQRSWKMNQLGFVHWKNPCISIYIYHITANPPAKKKQKHFLGGFESYWKISAGMMESRLAFQSMCFLPGAIIFTTNQSRYGRMQFTCWDWVSERPQQCKKTYTFNHGYCI